MAVQSLGLGDRVRLVCCTDPHTRLQPGAEGVVKFIDFLGTVHVLWDDGHQLGLCALAGDQWEHIACAWPRRNGSQP